MVGKKKKQATAKRMARAKSHANNNNHTSDGVATQASTLRAPSKKSKTITTSPVVASPARPAVGKYDTILALPLEIREIVYNHVLTTGIVDESTKSRVVVVGERRELREGSTSRRKHDYTTVNFKPKQLSITRVCKQMREDTMAMTWPRTVFRFTSTVALSRFVGHLGYRGTNKEVAQLNVALLHQVKKIECEVGDQKGTEWHLDYLHDVDEQLNRPLAMTFLDTISPDNNKGPKGPSLLMVAELKWQEIILSHIERALLKEERLRQEGERREARARSRQERDQISQETEAAIEASESTYMSVLLAAGRS